MESGDVASEPIVVQSDALDPEVAAELERAFEEERVVMYQERPYVVQKLEGHVDPGTGAPVQRFELLPTEPGQEAGQG